MDDWKNFKHSYTELVNSAKKGSDENILESWNKFVKISNNLSNNPPLIFKTLQKTLIAYANNNYKLRICDHGCGSGRMIFYLYTLGFKNIYGVNVNDDVDSINRILKIIDNKPEKPFFRTNGSSLPFEDSYFDVVISCQVLEHIPNNLIDTYYNEQSRCLKSGGMLYNEVPHRFNPYDSHTQTWFLHWLPNFIKFFLFKRFSIFFFNKIPKNIRSKHVNKLCDGSFLILRTPFFHYKKLKSNNFKFKNITQSRLIADFNDLSYDSDSNLKLRILIDRLFKIKFFGNILSFLFANFFMITTVSILNKDNKKSMTVHNLVDKIYN